MEGWTKLYKNNYYILVWDSLWKNPLSSKPNYLAVFLYILSHAYKKDKEVIINNQKILVKRGQWLGSVRKIAKHFNLSPSTVYYILDYLKVEQIVEHKVEQVVEHKVEQRPFKRFSLFTVLNYDKYQPQLEQRVEQVFEQRVEHKVELKDKDIYKDKDNKDKDIYNNAPASKEAGIVQNLLLEEEKKSKIRYEYQYLGLEIFERTGAPPEKKAECIRIAKVYPRGKVMAALTFCLDYPNPKLKWKMFLWKLNQLLKEEKENGTSE